MKKQLLFFATMLFCLAAVAQTTINGKITDEAGDPLINAAVIEKGTTNGTISDANGSYSITVKSSDAVLVFSYVGYEKMEIKTQGNAQVDVVMKSGNLLNSLEIVGTRRPDRTQTETPVAVDIIDISKLNTTNGYVEINQLLQYVAPSFNSTKQSGADGADHIDPATLRGLGPDQTLVLINGKRRHQSSLINIFGSRGRGNTGTDLNAIPVNAIERIEILRDGASAQYGSDAIAGVINIVLKSSVNEFNGIFTSGMNTATPPSEYNVLKPKESYDGQTWQLGLNNGVKIGEKGFANFTLDYSDKKRTNRPSDPAKYDIYRNQFGDAASNNLAFFMNSSFSAAENTEVYSFGGYNYRFSDAYAWTRTPDENRNVLAIYPNGFDPKIQSIIQDKSFSFGVRSILPNKWNMDVNNTFGGNNFHFIVNNTLNASLDANSPTRFDAGGFSFMQNSSTINFSKLYDVLSGLNIAFGAEMKLDNYKIFAGEEGSWKTYGKIIFSIDSVTGDTTYRPGGSQGFPGFQPSNEVNESRSSIGAYVDAELDITKSFLISAALRMENYSDFGNTTNGKFAARYKINKYVSLRTSASTGFRAPSLAQLYYNTTFTDFVGGVPIDKIIAKNNSPITRALGIPELKEEKSVNISGGFTAKYKSFSLTVDAYYVQIKDRIVLTGAFYDDDSIIGANLQALNVGAAQFFTNAVNTTTKGLDVVLTYSPLVTNTQILRLSVIGNFNNMTIDEVYTNDKLKGKENTYFGLREKYFLLASAPKSKAGLNLDYSYKNFFADIRLNMFGKVELINWMDNGDDIADKDELDVYNSKMTTNLAIGYKFKNLVLTVGGNNITNQYPDAHDPSLTETGGIWDAVQMGYAGAYYYTKLGFNF